MLRNLRKLYVSGPSAQLSISSEGSVQVAGAAVSTRGDELYVSSTRARQHHYRWQRPREQQQEEEEEQLQQQEEEFSVSMDECQVSLISVEGEAEVRSLPRAALDDSLTVHLSGSGLVRLPQGRYRALQVVVHGSGQVDGGDSSVDSCSVVVVRIQLSLSLALASHRYLQSGSGSVRGLHVSGSGMVTLSGSGRVELEADDVSRVTSTRSGSGRISISPSLRDRSNL